MNRTRLSGGVRAPRGRARTRLVAPCPSQTDYQTDLPVPHRGATPTAKERKVSLLSVELSRERIRDQDRKIKMNVEAAVRVRAIKRARRDAQVRALRLRRLLLAR
ncbi:MAG: hypothetical protein JWN00_1176 [Actinomycetia bacterium]|jgi:hypothetical protein|nr:hypothetical protein [Actinomycetes bacterium]